MLIEEIVTVIKNLTHKEVLTICGMVDSKKLTDSFENGYFAEKRRIESLLSSSNIKKSIEINEVKTILNDID